MIRSQIKEMVGMYGIFFEKYQEKYKDDRVRSSAIQPVKRVYQIDDPMMLGRWVSSTDMFGINPLAKTPKSGYKPTIFHEFTHPVEVMTPESIMASNSYLLYNSVPDSEGKDFTTVRGYVKPYSGHLGYLQSLPRPFSTEVMTTSIEELHLLKDGDRNSYVELLMKVHKAPEQYILAIHNLHLVAQSLDIDLKLKKKKKR